MKTKSQNSTIELNLQQKFKRLFNKLGFDSNEAKLKHNTLSNQQKASIERCHLLYEKGKIKNEVNKLVFVKNNEIKEKKELSECTFKPRTNSAKKLIIKDEKIEEKDKKMFERASNWMKKTSDKYNDIYLELTERRLYPMKIAHLSHKYEKILNF